MTDSGSTYITAREDGTIVSGHGRVYVLAAMGGLEVPVQILDENNQPLRVEVRQIALLR